MNKNTLTIALVFLTLAIHAQNVELLKEDNGYQEFTFGSPPGNYENIAFGKTIEDFVVYSVIGPRTAFGLMETWIELTFMHDSLYDITLYNTECEESDFYMFKTALEELYGPSKEILIKVSGAKLGEYWQCENLYIFLEYFTKGLVKIRYHMSCF